MRACLHCGGSALRDYAYGCEHVFDVDYPEIVSLDNVISVSFFRDVPSKVALCVECSIPERSFLVVSDFDGDDWLCQAEHPRREEAIALWKEKYRTGQFVDALFRLLSKWCKEGDAETKEREKADHPRGPDVSAGCLTQAELRESYATAPLCATHVRDIQSCAQ